MNVERNKGDLQTTITAETYGPGQLFFSNSDMYCILTQVHEPTAKDNGLRLVSLLTGELMHTGSFTLDNLKAWFLTPLNPGDAIVLEPKNE